MLTKIENINLSNNITKCKVSADNTCGLLHALGEITPANVTSTPTPDETIGSDDNDEPKVFQSRHSRVNRNHQEKVFSNLLVQIFRSIHIATKEVYMGSN